MYTIKLGKYIKHFEFLHINPIDSEICKQRRNTIFVILVKEIDKTLHVI